MTKETQLPNQIIDQLNNISFLDHEFINVLLVCPLLERMLLEQAYDLGSIATLSKVSMYFKMRFITKRMAKPNPAWKKKYEALPLIVQEMDCPNKSLYYWVWELVE